MFAAYVWENVYIKEMGFETILKVQKRSNTSFADKFPWRWKHHKKNICQPWPWSIWMLYHESTKNREIGHSQLWTLKSTRCKSKSPTWINGICKSSRFMLASQARPWVSNVPSGTRSLPPSWWNTTEDLHVFFCCASCCGGRFFWGNLKNLTGQIQGWWRLSSISLLNHVETTWLGSRNLHWRPLATLMEGLLATCNISTCARTEAFAMKWTEHDGTKKLREI